MTKTFDLFVIGGGSGGVRAARVAAAHGARVGITEEYRVGGTCVIRGCIPKKMLVYGARFAEDLKDARSFGWQVPECAFHWSTLRDNVLADVDRLESVYQTILDSHHVETFKQRATVTGPHSCKLADGVEIRAEKILIATGARPMMPDVPGCDLGITSNEAFHLDAVPRRVLIVGGGYIANEFAGIFNEFGSKVTLICRSGSVLTTYDESLQDRLIKISISKGIEFHFHAKLLKIERGRDGSFTTFVRGLDPIVSDCVLFAIGRDPNSRGIGLEEAGVEIDRKGGVKVDAYAQTTVSSIFAVGDVTNRVQLTPVAIREGHAFADTQFGGIERTVDYRCIPSAVFSHPPIAAVGLTEQRAREQFGSVSCYSSDFEPMRNSFSQRREQAYYKMVCDSGTDRVLGLHMIGPDTPEILQAAAVAIKAGLTREQFNDTVSIFPTMAEELVALT